MHCHIHVFYSPGLGSDGAVDKLVEKTCEDADVFVYVCDGTRTLEEMVKSSFEHRCILLICNIYSTVGRSIADIYDPIEAIVAHKVLHGVWNLACNY